MGKETSFLLHAADVMNQNVPVVERDMPVSHLINMLLKTREKNAIIIDRNEKVTGLITPKIFFKNMINLGHFWKERGTMLPSKYVELIAEKVPTIPPQTPLLDVIKTLSSKTPFIDGILVEEKDEILGIITAEDILRAVLDNPLLSTPVKNILPKDAKKRIIQKYSTIAHVIQTTQELDTDCLVV
ncbi:MAG: HPP family protein, partial [Asgard group archaeon]